MTQLLWQTPACTGSVLYASREVHDALAAIQGETGPGQGIKQLLQELESFEKWLAALPMEKIFPARTLELDRGLTRKNAFPARAQQESQDCMAHMTEVLERLHDRLEDTFFSHHPEMKET